MGTLGPLPAVLVTVANVSDSAGDIHLLSRIADAHPQVTTVWTDTGHRIGAIDGGARLGVDVAGGSSGPSAGSCTTAGPAARCSVR
ncbi:hypothetical protein GCM10010405_43150 [Streptomyces macrosporus]|uniref:Uncharacterized protein n=1 Tax=Streptomyces macrosporus TaxID=44032 RepID=A0ABP5XFJ9_9ACTN